MALDKNVIRALSSPDVQERKRAIIKLAKSGEEAALPYLARAYKHDDEASLRQLARKGGIHLKRLLEEASFIDEDYNPYGYEVYDDEPAYHESSSSDAQPAEPNAKKAKPRRRSVYDDGRTPKLFATLLLYISMLGAAMVGISMFMSWMGSDALSDGFAYSGMDIAGNKDESAIALSLPENFDRLESEGISINNASMGMLTDRNILTYSPYILPIVAFAQFFIAFATMSDRSNAFFWGIGLIMAIAAGFVFYWFYDALTGLVDLLAGFGAGELLGAGDVLLANGYTIGSIGAIIMGVTMSIGLVLSFMIEEE